MSSSYVMRLEPQLVRQSVGQLVGQLIAWFAWKIVIQKYTLHLINFKAFVTFVIFKEEDHHNEKYYIQGCQGECFLKCINHKDAGKYFIYYFVAFLFTFNIHYIHIVFIQPTSVCFNLYTHTHTCTNNNMHLH